MSDAEYNFTLRARRLLVLAQAEAGRLNHDAVTAEHLLLALTRLGEGVATDVLRKMAVNLQALRVNVENQLGGGSAQRAVGRSPHSPQTSTVLALAEEERIRLNHSYLGTEHILLGMLRAGDSIALRVLTEVGVETEKARAEIVSLLES